MRTRTCLISAAGLCVAVTGCPSPSLYTTPRTIPRGTIQHTVAAEAIGVAGGGAAGFVPTLPTYQLRLGVHEQVDLGFRIANMSGLGADLKWNFLRSRGFDLAIDPGFQIYLWGVSSSSDASSFVIGYAHLPLLLGFNFGESVTLLLSPGFSWGFGSLSNSEGTTGFASGALARFGVGANFRLTRGFALQPEVTFLKPFEQFSDSGVFITFGIGLQFGAMPDHTRD